MRDQESAREDIGGDIGEDVVVGDTAVADEESPADGEVTRRGVLGGLLAAPVLAGSAVRAAAAAPDADAAAPLAHAAPGALPAQSQAPAPVVPHSVVPRGMDVAVRTTRTTEARFGLMFKTLRAYTSPTDPMLENLGQQMVDPTPPLNDLRLSTTGNNPNLPAGYLYFGQFVDHDMTLDTTPLGQQQADPVAVTNFDTPWFDLGSMYGKGPTDPASANIYDRTRPGFLRLVRHDEIDDLPRDPAGAAYVGDPRNDENLLVAQMHIAFIKLHNRFMTVPGTTFADAQRTTRWHYQWVIVNDFLPRIVGSEIVNQVLVKLPNGAYRYAGKFYRPRDTRRPFMPVEYSTAAYRWGHSGIRAEYEVHDIPNDNPTVPIFSNGGQDLRGSRPIPANMWVDWNYFFDVPGLSRPDDRNQSRLIDSILSMPLASLPPTVVAPVQGAQTALAKRNLLRGKQVGLPSGQDVATAMGVRPLTNAELKLDASWGTQAPLWFYVLKEAEIVARGLTLGPVGGRIVAEVIIGLLSLDPTSYLNAPTPFTPTTGLPFAMGDLLLLAGAIDPRVFANPPGAPDPNPAN